MNDHIKNDEHVIHENEDSIVLPHDVLKYIGCLSSCTIWFLYSCDKEDYTERVRLREIPEPYSIYKSDPWPAKSGSYILLFHRLEYFELHDTISYYHFIKDLFDEPRNSIYDIVPKVKYDVERIRIFKFWLILQIHQKLR